MIVMTRNRDLGGKSDIALVRRLQTHHKMCEKLDLGLSG